jgi:hypothetical protein
MASCMLATAMGQTQNLHVVGARLSWFVSLVVWHSLADICAAHLPGH